MDCRDLGRDVGDGLRGGSIERKVGMMVESDIMRSIVL